jgi:phosphatidylserine/phosphatidylglycerophosphate/cardiolipin synthase-like enzyme
MTAITQMWIGKPSLPPTVQPVLNENLEHVDVALIESAQREIDLAALTRAVDRGVKVRIYLDGQASRNYANRKPSANWPYPNLSTMEGAA